MFTFNSTDLAILVASFLWPLTRVLGMITASPLFGSNSIPMQAKVGLGVLVTLLITPVLPAMPLIETYSMPGFLILAQQFIIGVMTGFTIRLIFSAVELSGEMMSLTMGLGFATFFDPQTQGRSSAISQMMSLLILMIFICTDLHLLLISAVVDSFTTLPVSQSFIGTKGFWGLTNWASHIFSSGLQIALPILTALLIVNLSLGVLTRAAPQLNLFGIGFPITLSAGIGTLSLCMPYLLSPILKWLNDGFYFISQIPGLLKS